MKAFSLRLAGCLMGVFTLAAIEAFIVCPTWGTGVMLAVYAAAALQCCKSADRLDAAKQKYHVEVMDREQSQKTA